MRISDWSSDVCSSDLKPFEGVLPNLERRWRETESDTIRDDLSRYQSQTACETCGGHRLKQEALAVKISGKHIGEISELSILAARDWFLPLRSEERRVGKEWVSPGRSRWWPDT